MPARKTTTRALAGALDPADTPTATTLDLTATLGKPGRYTAVATKGGLKSARAVIRSSR